MMASCGSIAYVSPDVLKGSGYTNKTDLWSLGVITFMLLAGYPPFYGNEKDMREAIAEAKVHFIQSRWDKVSEDACDFVNRLLVKDPDGRMDAQAALSHQWIVSKRQSCIS